MLCPEREEIRLGVHRCLGSRKPMLGSERDTIRLGVHKCLMYNSRCTITCLQMCIS